MKELLKSSKTGGKFVANHFKTLKLNMYAHGAPCLKAKTWTRSPMTWGVIVDRLKDTSRTRETVSEYHNKKSHDEKSSLKDVGGFVAGVLDKGRRNKSSVISRSMLTMDMDNINQPSEEVVKQFSDLINCEAVFYSTHSHTPEKPRLRLIIPLKREVTPDEYQAISRVVADNLGMEAFDKVSFYVNQLMLWPSTPKDGEYFYQHHEGNLLDPDEYLKRLPDWKDVSSWPKHPEENKEIRASNTKQMDPLLKDGDIGRFNKAYSIQEAISTFLSDIYTPTDHPDVYTYSKGSTYGGAKVYEDKYLFSHHSTDPASGKECSAFDLVRIHLYGHLDDRARKEYTPENLPSFKKMLEHAREDTIVSRMALEDEFGAVLDSEEDEEKKQDHLDNFNRYIERNRRGQHSVNTAELAEVFKEEEHYLIVRKQGFDNDVLYFYEEGFYRKISTNEFKGRIKKYIPVNIRKPVQWEEVYKNLITETSTVKFEDLDTHQNYINFKNGLLNIQTMELEPHRPDIYSTFQLKFNYNPNAPAPKKWLESIERLTQGDPELSSMIQEWIGLTISNIPGFYTKKTLVLYSPIGNTGKTQVIKMITHLVGNEFISTTPIQDLGKPFGTSTLYGARALAIDDQKSSNFEDSSIWKSLTGGGSVDCEFKGKQSFSFCYPGTITLATNELPYLKDDKGGHSFGRFAIVPCTNVIPEEDRIGDIFEEFSSETEGVILWALEGLRRLIRNSYKLTYSAASEEALKSYREDNDTFYKWLNEAVDNTGDFKDKILKKDFEDHYISWCIQNGLSHLNYKNIRARAEKHGIVLRKHSNYYYLGVKWKDNP